MARKKAEPIISLGNDDELTVQKSLPLFSLWKSDLTLAEFKILDTYLGRIDSHKPDRRTVVFEKGELEKLLGVKRIRTAELDERLKHLGTPIRIDDKTSKNKKFSRVCLFEKSVAERDDNGLWQVELTASPSAMKYFFDIENLGYLRYKLRCVMNLNSRYSYILFCYLENNRFRKTWEVDLEQLKTILNCEQEECYKQYKVFNDRLMKRVYKEIHEKTECRYSYEPIKQGKRVVKIRFTVQSLAPEIDRKLRVMEENGQMDLETYEQLQNDELNLEPWKAELAGEDFTPAEMELLAQYLYAVPDSKMPDMTFGLWANRTHYIAQKLATMNAYAEKKPIKNRFNYLLAMIKADAGLED
jgi:hypothetical protein